MMELHVRLDPFVPPRWARAGHAQTLLGHFAPSPRLPGWGRRASDGRKAAWAARAAASDADGVAAASDLRPEDGLDLELEEDWEVAVSGGDRVIAHFFKGRKPVVVYIFHGLGGESHGSYMQRTALLALDLGYSAVIANHRGCGRGEGLAKEPYHSGRSEDLAAVVAEGRKRYPKHRHLAVGFSLSGNAVLLLAAGYRVPRAEAAASGSAGAGAGGPGALPDAVIAVNAPIELARASVALSTGLNRMYDWYFMRSLREAVSARERAGFAVPPGALKLRPLATCREFDQAYTAPAGGFRDREDYYATCSAMPHLKDLKIPTVMIMAEDDPFVPVDSYRRAELSPLAHLRLERFGGHMGFVAAAPTPLGSHRWLDWALHEYLVALE